ncbi:M1 family metallopeptidase [Flavitalea antarctica]
MNKLLMICLLLAHQCLSGQKPGASFDVHRYEYQVSVNDVNDSIKCLANIHLNLLKSTQSVSLDLVSIDRKGKGMKVLGIWSNKKPLPFSHEGSKLIITLEDQNIGNKNIVVSYTGIPADGLIISKTKYGKRSFFADNWPDRARHWLVCVDHPSDKAAVEFKITAPTHYQVIANGLLIEETNIDAQNKLTHWKEAIPLPTKVMAVGIADFAVNHLDSTGAVDISSWVYPEDRASGFHDFALAKEIIPFFEGLIAPFPFRKLANVQSKTTFGGLENAGAIFYAEQMITGQRTGESTIVHEIAHQWFGDMATEADYSHLWLSEGFATYMTMYYMEKKYGVNSANSLLAGDRQEVKDFTGKKLQPVVDSSVKSFMELLNPNSYQKASWVLHMLRQETGDEAFWKGIQLYYKSYAGKNAVTSDFQKIMEAVSGKDLKQFFYQWLYVAGQPQLDVSYQFNSQKKTITVTIVQQQPTLFNFPLQLTAVGKAGSNFTKDIDLKVTKKSTIADIPIDFEPANLLIDRNVRLLYEGATTASKR